MICQGCGIEAPTKYVSFHQNIGALIMRFPKSIEGRLCKSCIHKYFWSMTGTTFFLGWWGTISFIVTPFFLLNNVGRYLLCIPMPAVPIDATVPTLTDEVVERLNRHAPGMFDRLNDGEEFERVVQTTSDVTGATPGQVILYIQAVAQAQAESPQFAEPAER